MGEKWLLYNRDLYYWLAFVFLAFPANAWCRNLKRPSVLEKTSTRTVLTIGFLLFAVMRWRRYDSVYFVEGAIAAVGWMGAALLFVSAWRTRVFAEFLIALVGAGGMTIMAASSVNGPTAAFWLAPTLAIPGIAIGCYVAFIVNGAVRHQILKSYYEEPPSKLDTTSPPQ